MKRRIDWQACVGPALIALFFAAIAHIIYHIDPEPPQYERYSMPQGQYKFTLPSQSIDLVVPKSPLLDYPSEGFEFSNTPASPKRKVTGFYLANRPEKTPLISVVTLVNSVGAVQYLNESLQSLMQQSLQEFEWILLFSSTEFVRLTTPVMDELLAPLPPTRPPIYVIYPPKIGMLIDYFTVMGRAANASLVFHLAVDSMLEPTALEKFYWHMMSYEEKGLAAVSGLPVYLSSSRRSLPAAGFQLGELMLEKYILPTEMMWRKEVWTSMMPAKEVSESAQLWFNWLRFVTQGSWGSSVQEHLSWERVEWQTWKWTTVEITEGARRPIRAVYKDLFLTGLKPPTFAPSPPQWRHNSNLNILGTAAASPRLLLLVEKFEASLTNPSIDLMLHLQRDGYAVTLVSLHGKPVPQLFISADVFFLASFLSLPNFAPFVLYLCRSRSFDSVLLVGSIPSFLVTGMQAVLPHASFVHYLPLSSTLSPDPAFDRSDFPATISLIQESIDPQLKAPLLLPLDEWVEAPAARLFQRQNYFLRTDVPLIVLPIGASLEAANDTAVILSTLESSQSLAGTIVVLRDRLASLEAWSAVHPLFRWAARNGTASGPVRVLVVSTHEPTVYQAWLKAADGVLLMHGSVADVMVTWHRVSMSGAWVALGPAVSRDARLPKTIIHEHSTMELSARLFELLDATSAGLQQQRVREEAASLRARSMSIISEALKGEARHATSFDSEEDEYIWLQQQVKEAGWM